MDDEVETEGDAGSSPPRPDGPRTKRRPRPRAAETIGGVLFGFDQQVWRTQPPPHELVHHARRDAPVAAGDGGWLQIDLPEPVASDDPPRSANGSEGSSRG